MVRRNGFGFCLISVSIASTLIGCGDPNHLPTFETTGSVSYTDGQSVEEGTVLFVADGLPPGRSIIENGEYSIGTYGDGDGAVAGNFRVAVTVNPPIDFDPDAGKPPPKMPKEKYSAPDTSGLEFEVKTEGENRFDIELERRP